MSVGTHSETSLLPRRRLAPRVGRSGRRVRSGHIARHRSINTAIYTATDRWFHYDQVGSVMLETNATGAAATTYQPDAFGNQMASWQTGLWTNSYASRKGWHHNTKEFDGDTGLVYMYQRWYLPETGTFVSQAPYPPMLEHQYVFARMAPGSFIDPLGRFNWPWPFNGEVCNEGLVPILIYDADLEIWRTLAPGQCADSSEDWDFVLDCHGMWKVGGFDEFKETPNGPVEDDLIWDDPFPAPPPGEWLPTPPASPPPPYVPPPPSVPPIFGPGPHPLCPRVDALCGEEWVTVGRAIKYNLGRQNEKSWVIHLDAPASYFRLVEDESEISVVRWIKGDGEDWGIGEVITKPAEPVNDLRHSVAAI